LQSPFCVDWDPMAVAERRGATARTHVIGFCETPSRYDSRMRLADEPTDPPEPDPNEVPERLAPVDVPEPAVKDTPERA
jgi:hypothetical protein